MSEIITSRDIDIVTAEIITIRQQAQKMMLAAVVEIGKRLCEAKELLPHGAWGRWLEKSVSYSQSTANNMMALYREYGEKDQVNLFDDANSQLLQKLSYTQALALMAVPEEERAEFVAENKVEDMSTRELQQAIRERDEARAESQRYFDKLEEKEDELWSADKRAEEYKTEAAASQAKVERLQKELNAIFRDKKENEQVIDDLQTKLEKAKADAKKAEDQLKETQESPAVSNDVMAKLRQEAEEAAAKRIAEEADKKIIELQKKLDEANVVAASATKKQADTAAQLVAAQKAVKMSAPEIAVFKSMFEVLQDGINKINGYRLRTAQSNPDAAQGMGKALNALFAKALEDLR